MYHKTRRHAQERRFNIYRFDSLEYLPAVWFIESCLTPVLYRVYSPCNGFLVQYNLQRRCHKLSPPGTWTCSRHESRFCSYWLNLQTVNVISDKVDPERTCTSKLPYLLIQSKKLNYSFSFNFCCGILAYLLLFVTYFSCMNWTIRFWPA